MCIVYFYEKGQEIIINLYQSSKVFTRIRYLDNLIYDSNKKFSWDLYKFSTSGKVGVGMHCGKILLYNQVPVLLTELI